VSNIIINAAEEVLRQNDKFFSLTHFYLKVADHARRKYGWVGNHYSKKLLGHDLVAEELRKRPDLLAQVRERLCRRPSSEVRRAVVRRLRGRLASGILSPGLPKLPRDHVVPICIEEGVDSRVVHSAWREVRRYETEPQAHSTVGTIGNTPAFLDRVHTIANAIARLHAEVRRLEEEASALCVENGRLREENSHLAALREKVAAAERLAAAIEGFLACFARSRASTEGRVGGEKYVVDKFCNVLTPLEVEFLRAQN